MVSQKGKTSPPPLIPQASALFFYTITPKALTDLKFTSLIFLTFMSQNLQGFQQLSPEWMSSPRSFQIWVRLWTKAKICSYRSQGPNLDKTKRNTRTEISEDREGKHERSPPLSTYILPLLLSQPENTEFHAPLQTYSIRTGILTDSQGTVTFEKH